jgi:hypothetical protein
VLPQNALVERIDFPHPPFGAQLRRRTWRPPPQAREVKRTRATQKKLTTRLIAIRKSSDSVTAAVTRGPMFDFFSRTRFRLGEARRNR